VLQAPVLDGDACAAGAPGEDSFVPAELGVGWRHLSQRLMVSLVIRVFDERADLGFEVAGQPGLVLDMGMIAARGSQRQFKGVGNILGLHGRV